MPAPKGFKFKAKSSASKAGESGGNKRGPSNSAGNSPKRRAGEDSSSSSSSPGRKSKDSPSSTQKRKNAKEAAELAAKEEEARKNTLRYPKIDINIDAVAKKLKLTPSSTRSHADILVSIVKEVCDVEALGLVKYFENQHDKSAIHDALKSVLEKLPNAVKTDCPTDAVFQPEILNDEQVEIAQLHGLLVSLQEQKIHMTKYLNDPSSFINDYDLWLNGPSDEALVAAGGSNGNDESSSSSSSGVASRAAAAYENVLENLGDECTELIGSIKQLTKLVDNATKAQQRLYKVHQDTRLDGVAPVKAPKQTKELVKGLSKM